MLELLRSNKAASLALTTLLAVCAAVPFFWLQTGNQLALDGPMIKMLTLLPKWLVTTLGFLCLLAAPLLANYTVLKHQLVVNENRLVAFCVAIISALFISLGIDALLAISLLLFIRLVDRCFEIQKSIKPNNLIFDASFIVGLLGLMSTSFYMLIILVWFSGLYSGRFSLKAFILSLFTIFLVSYLTYSMLYLFDVEVVFPTLEFGVGIKLALENEAIVLMIGLLLMVLGALSSLFDALRLNKVAIKNHLGFLLWSLLVLIILNFLLTGTMASLLLLMTFPISVILSQQYIRSKRRTFFSVLLSFITLTFLGYEYFLLFVQ